MFLDIIISLLGVTVILLVMSDFVRTTLRLEGSGRMSAFIMRALWRGAGWAQERLPHRNITAQAGVIILLGNLLTWALLLWVGWLLVFLPHIGSVVSSRSGEPAGLWSSLYFVGYSLITLGIGDYVPGAPLFQVATVLAAMSGFFLFTLAVTYLVPVVAAVAQARQLAVQTLLLGKTPTELADWVIRTGASGLRQLSGLTAPIVLLSQHHFAYPVLTYFPGTARSTSSAVALAVLDEAITILLHGLPREDGLEASLSPLRGAIERYLELHVATLEAEPPAAPPAPSLAALAEAGCEPVSEAEFGDRIAELERRRALLRLLVETEGRNWSAVAGG